MEKLEIALRSPAQPLVHRSLIIRLLSGLLHLAAALAVLAVVLYRQNGFGNGDTTAFLFWTVPLAAGLTGTGPALAGLLRGRPLAVRLGGLALAAGLLALGWAYGVTLLLGPLVGAFSFPIFYLWAAGAAAQLGFLSWYLPAPAVRTTAGAVVRSLLAVPLTALAAAGGLFALAAARDYLTRPAPETFLLPTGYSGRVRVVYNQPDGAAPALENGRRLYRIPPTGVLFTQFPDEHGLIDQQYYDVAASGQRRPLPVLDTRDFNEEWTTTRNPHEPPRTHRAVFNPGTTGSIGAPNAASRKVFQELLVGTYNDLRDLPDFTLDYLDSLQAAERRAAPALVPVPTSAFPRPPATLAR